MQFPQSIQRSRSICAFPSISFIIISLFNKDRITIFIMLSIYLASFLSLLFVNNNQKNSNEIIINNDFTSTYFNVFNSSIKSIFSIYFSILFFTMISKILTNNINNIYLNYFISGIFEFSLPSINLVNEINITFIHYISFRGMNSAISARDKARNYSSGGGGFSSSGGGGGSFGGGGGGGGFR